MRRVILVGMLLWGVVYAQPSVPALLPKFDVFPFFNSDYIQQHHIRKISTTVMLKYPMKTLIGSVKKQEFSFGKEGKPTCYAQTSAAGYTVKNRYTYTDNGQVLSVTNNKESEVFTYDGSGFVTQKRTVNALSGEAQTEQFRKEQVNETQQKKYWLNTEQLTYKYCVTNYNAQGQPIDATTRFVRGAHRTNETWDWKQNWLSEYTIQTREFASESHRYVMHYNAQFEVLKMEVYTNGSPSHVWEYLYEEGLLTAILAKDLSNNCITITKLHYQFWE